MATYHVIPHTHWDREWYLSFDHFRVLLVHLMNDLLDLLREREDYPTFLLDGQTVVLDDYLDVHPERRDEIARHVAAGRLSVGPWYVLPDTFLVSGEALVRNLLRGRAAARAFGRVMNVGYIPDSFGHTAQIPQVLRGFGMDTALVWRGFGGEPGQEGSEYRWRSPDGAEVLMEHLSDVGYSAAYFDGAEPADVEARFADFRRRIDPRARTPERLVLSGGDHHWPTPLLPEAIAHLNAVLDGDDRVVHSSLERFATALRQGAAGLTLPDVDGELRFGYRWAFNVTGGVYSSRMPLKQQNAAGQRLLERYLEPLNVLAVRAGGASQHALIRQGWTYLLQNHPHDSICGCSIDPVHREMQTRFEKLRELGRGVARMAWLRLAPDVEGAPGDDGRLTFFNPSPFARDAVVSCEVTCFKQDVVVGLNPDVVPDPPQPPVQGFTLQDADGRVVPFEVIDRRDGYGIAYTRFGYPAQSRVERFALRVLLENLPPLGLRTLRIARADAFSAEPVTTGLSAGEQWCMENHYLRVAVRPDGAFVVVDKATDQVYGPLGYFEDGADAGDEYNYSPPPDDRVYRSIDTADVSIEKVPGRFRVGLRVQGAWALPARLTDDLQRRTPEQRPLSFSTTASLTPFSRYVTFETTLCNTVSDHRLRVLFETGRRTNRHHADNAFAILTREQRAYDPAAFAIEVPAAVAPMHRFVTVEDERGGATILGDGLPEYELKHDSGGVLALTLLRCVGELGRDDLTMRPGGKAGWHNETPEAQCRGEHRFRYAFMPHPPDWTAHLAGIQAGAEAFLLPVRWTTDKKDEPPPPDRPFLRVAPQALVLSALKEAEDGDGVVLRIYNPGPNPVQGAVSFEDPPVDVRSADLEETPGTPVALRDGVLRDTWPPFRIHTYRFSFQPSAFSDQGTDGKKLTADG